MWDLWIGGAPTEIGRKSEANWRETPGVSLQSAAHPSRRSGRESNV